MKTPITCEERSRNSEILQKSFQINQISRLNKGTNRLEVPNFTVRLEVPWV